MSSPSSIILEIHQRLNEVRQHLYRTDAKAKAFLFGILLVASPGAAALLELVFQFNSGIRTIFAVNIIVGAAACAAWLVLRPLFRVAGILSIDDDFAVAHRVGKFFPSIRDRLTNLLQLQQEAAKRDTLYSVELLEASFKDLADVIRPVDFNRCVDESVVTKMRKWFSVTAAGTAFLILLFPSSMPNAYYRLAHFGREFVPAPRFTFDVSPGNKEIVKGERVEVRVKLSSSSQFISRTLPLDLFYRVKGQDRYDQVSMRQDSVDLYHTVLSNVRNSTEYLIRAANAQSTKFTLTVLDRPIIRSFKVRLESPAYSRLPTRIQEEFAGDVTGLAGSKVFINGIASKDLNEASIVFDRDSLSSMDIAGNGFTGNFRLVADGSYYVELTDEDSLINFDPVRYNLKVIPDETPTVSIVEPGRNLDIAGDQTMRLLIRAGDDFGFTQMRLGFRLLRSRYQEGQQEYTYSPIPLPMEPQTELEISYVWNLEKLTLVPEDVVEYFVEVFDNDAIKGPKSARSNVYLLRLPSLEEVFSDVNQGHEQTMDEIKKAMEDTKKLKQDIESINTDIKKNKDIDWQKQKKMEGMTKKYQEIQKTLQRAEQQLNQMVQKMDQQNVLSKETLDKYMELQQLFQELNSSELQQAMKQMQQAIQNVNKDQLQQAMQQVQFSEERFRQGIERTLELLKRIQIEQKVDEIKKRAQELEQLQDDVKKETESMGNDPQKWQEGAKKQEGLSRKENQLEQQSAELAKRMEEFYTEMPVDKLNAANQQLQQQKLAQRMKNAARQMQQGQMQQAQQSQQQIQEGLQSFSQQMEAMQQGMLQQQAQQTVNALRKATNDLLELSKREEALKQQAQDAPSNSSQLRQNAENQFGVLQDLNNVVNGLSELSKKSFAVTPEMGKAIGEAAARMQGAMRNLDVRNGQMAAQEQGSAMGSLNKAAVQVQNALQALMQGGQGGVGGLLQQLQMLAGQQMGLNMKSEQLGQGMSMQQAAEAARLAKEQDAIRKSLDQLNKEAQQSQEQKRLLGDLDKISEDMKEVVRNLEQNNVNPQTLKQQERILSRLLDASKSMRERDYEKRRKAQTGTEIVRKSPQELDIHDLNGMSKLRQDLLKALEEGYSKDYQELIRKYFEELQKIENQ